MGFSLKERGTPRVDPQTCTGCGQCVEICPDRVLELHEGKARATDGIFMGCVACGHCVAICPTAAVAVTGRTMRADDGFDPPLQRATAEQLEALLFWRRSVRRFTAREVERETIDRILAMTAAAPMGIPPSDVGVVVLLGREKVQAFATDACALFARQAKGFSGWRLAHMRLFMGKAGYEVMRDFVRPLLEMLAGERAAGRDAFTYDAPAALLFHHGQTADSADVHIAATYAMLAAESLGLGSCLLGTAVAFNFDKAFRQRHGIPVDNKVGLMLALGYPDVQFRRGVRRRLADVKFA